MVVVVRDGSVPTSVMEEEMLSPQAEVPSIRISRTNKVILL
jgi:hypothetical protein